MELFTTFDFSHLKQEAVWLLIIYSATLAAMFIDLLTGVRKARNLGEITTSRGFRKTAEKAMQYLLPMFCLTLIDAICSVFWTYPFLTAFMAAFNIYIELKSVWENTHSIELTKVKEECAKDLIKFITEHKDDIEKILTK